MRREGATPAEYLAGLDGWRLEKVEHLRRLILQHAPQVTESARSGFLYYDDDGDLFALAAQKHYVALYVLAPEAMATHRGLLDQLDCGKGCIRFRARTQVPEAALVTVLEAAVASKQRDCH